jgi:hypothetical protein
VGEKDEVLHVAALGVEFRLEGVDEMQRRIIVCLFICGDATFAERCWKYFGNFLLDYCYRSDFGSASHATSRSFFS